MNRTRKANYMLDSIKQRLGRDDEQGFTLIELMVVVLIIAILLAIAIPTFLGAKNTANARGAQSSLRNALTAEQTYFTNNNQQFGAPGSMSTIEPNLNWVTTTPSSTTAGPNNVYAVPLDGNLQVAIQAYGKDGNCYTVFQNNDPAVTTGGSGNGANTGYSVQKGSCPTPAAWASAQAVSSGNASSSISTTSGGTYYTGW